MSFLGRNKSPRCLSTHILFSFSDPNSIMCLCILIFQQISSMIYVYVLSHVSNSLRPHGLYHARLPCPLLSPRICSNVCPLSQWCHPTISSSVTPYSSCPQSFPASESFLMSQLFPSSGQSIGVSASTSVLPVNIQDWFPSGWTHQISLKSKGLSRFLSTTTFQKHQFFCAQLSL